MNYEAMLSESFEYTKEALWGRWGRWALLVVCTIIFPLLYGYILEVLRGTKPAPELQNWWKLFVDGILYLVISIIYAIPIIIVAIFTVGGSALFFISGNPAMNVGGPGMLVIGFLVIFILAILIGLIAIIGMVRFARTEKFGEAFNFSGILATIDSIGWGSYILALIILYVVVGVVSFVLAVIPFLGVVLSLIFSAPIAIFTARYIALLYDDGAAA
ncbi:MAG: DUF4013 domain-containing protein [Methanomicrobiales archaeon]